MDELFDNSMEDSNANIMAIYGTLVNKAAAFSLYTEKSFFN
jgi:hypothetical protein